MRAVDYGAPTGPIALVVLVDRTLPSLYEPQQQSRA
jgi:hypothetical protein